MTTLVESMIVVGAENCPPMLDKEMYDSWASRMRLYIKGKKHDRMMLDSVDNGSLVYPTIEVDAAKDIWDRVKLLIKGTELSYQERDCKLYNVFDIFTFVLGETLYEYYWRFSQLINDMHTISITMQQVQINTKFYECSTTGTDQHERHANEVRIQRERYPNQIALVAHSLTLYNPS
ncbi:hypothetical protein Tco_0383205 [Tanacetum coccineum]